MKERNSFHFLGRVSKKIPRMRKRHERVSWRIRRVASILKLLDGGTISSGSYDSTSQPFFLQDASGRPFSIGRDHSFLPKIPEGLNSSMVTLYSILAEPDREVYFRIWTLLSFNSALERYEMLRDAGQTFVFDVAFTYAGMGHVLVVSCDLGTHQFFCRMDGGSNGFDREENRRSVVSKGSSGHAQFGFSGLLQKLKETIPNQ
jgi:hypothetical protein